MLQIEIFPQADFRSSKSVTRGTEFAELLLQIEMFGRTEFVRLDL